MMLEHDPDPKGRVSAKWAPVFRKDHAQTRSWRAMTNHPEIIALQRGRSTRCPLDAHAKLVAEAA
jgi:hypothetical protein